MATDSFAVAFPLPSQECSDPCPYQEKGHHSANIKQQEFTEEVWFHQLLSTHEPPPICTLIFTQRASGIKVFCTTSEPSGGVTAGRAWPGSTPKAKWSGLPKLRP